MLSDGFHSLTDTASNIVGIIGVRIAGAPPDDDHPYGHRKFETMASLGILMFLLLVLREVLSAAWERFQTGGEPAINALTFVVMGGTFAVNLGVVFYERRAGRRLQSEVLLADAHHTMSDLMTSATVIVALIGVQARLRVARSGRGARRRGLHRLRVLGDLQVDDRHPRGSVRDSRGSRSCEVVKSVPEVIGCHHIRTRGSADFVFLDLHIWMDADMPLDEAHRAVARREGSADGALPADQGRDHPHRAAAEESQSRS